MSNGKIRIGIDVGGTFTHAVAVSIADNKVVAHAVTPTTHTSEGSVSEGIIHVFREILRQTGISPHDVCFVAHSTTQATNALLEGDVAWVGIVGMGHGMEGMKAKSDTNIRQLELSPGKYLNTKHIYVDTGAKKANVEMLAGAVESLKEAGCEVLVASEAFGVDDPSNECSVLELAEERGIPATASHEISQLYGLKIRTRTAVINASILPKMTATALLTDKSIKESGITAPLMVMRSDGGVMDLTQMKRRPILTMLSGPAAGIAAALMFAKISDGIFLEVGGTSTDISAIKNGRAMIRSASVGGHRTYLKTLDSRTVGIGGGSMVRMKGNAVEDTGPRSAHIAGLNYLAFSTADELRELQGKLIRPMPTDPDDYLVAVNPAGKYFAVTLTDASIVAGTTREGDYAFANREAVCIAFESIGRQYEMDGFTLAAKILEKAGRKVAPVVQALVEDYSFDRELVSLVGGGGGCTAIVPWLSQSMSMKYLITEKAEVISAIGAALAMLRDSVERTVANPGSEEIASIRKEAIGRMLAMGAVPDTVEVQIEIDAGKNILRAMVTGALQMEKNAADLKLLSSREIHCRAAKSFKAQEEDVMLAARTNGLTVFSHRTQTKGLLGLFKKMQTGYRVLDHFGVVKLQCVQGSMRITSACRAQEDLKLFVEKESDYNDAGMILPEIFVLYKSRVVDYSTILDYGQLKELLSLELEGIEPEEPIVLLEQARKG